LTGEDTATEISHIPALFISASTHLHIDLLKESLLPWYCRAMYQLRILSSLMPVISCLAEVLNHSVISVVGWIKIPSDLIALISALLHYLGEITGRLQRGSVGLILVSLYGK